MQFRHTEIINERKHVLLFILVDHLDEPESKHLQSLLKLTAPVCKTFFMLILTHYVKTATQPVHIILDLFRIVFRLQNLATCLLRELLLQFPQFLGTFI